MAASKNKKYGLEGNETIPKSSKTNKKSTASSSKKQSSKTNKTNQGKTSKKRAEKYNSKIASGKEIKRRRERTEEEIKMIATIIGITLISFAVIISLGAYFGDAGIIGKVMGKLLPGMFGIAGFLIPIFMIFIGVYMFRKKTHEGLLSFMPVMLVVFFGVMLLDTYRFIDQFGMIWKAMDVELLFKGKYFTGSLTNCYILGTDLRASGMLGGLVGYILYNIIGKTGLLISAISVNIIGVLLVVAEIPVETKKKLVVLMGKAITYIKNTYSKTKDFILKKVKETKEKREREKIRKIHEEIEKKEVVERTPLYTEEEYNKAKERLHNEESIKIYEDKLFKDEKPVIVNYESSDRVDNREKVYYMYNIFKKEKDIDNTLALYIAVNRFTNDKEKLFKKTEKISRTSLISNVKESIANGNLLQSSRNNNNYANLSNIKPEDRSYSGYNNPYNVNTGYEEKYVPREGFGLDEKEKTEEENNKNLKKNFLNDVFIAKRKGLIKEDEKTIKGERPPVSGFGLSEKVIETGFGLEPLIKEDKKEVKDAGLLSAVNIEDDDGVFIDGDNLLRGFSNEKAYSFKEKKDDNIITSRFFVKGDLFIDVLDLKKRFEKNNLKENLESLICIVYRNGLDVSTVSNAVNNTIKEERALGKENKNIGSTKRETRIDFSKEKMEKLAEKETGLSGGVSRDKAGVGTTKGSNTESHRKNTGLGLSGLSDDNAYGLSEKEDGSNDSRSYNKDSYHKTSEGFARKGLDAGLTGNAGMGIGAGVAGGVGAGVTGAGAVGDGIASGAAGIAGGFSGFGFDDINAGSRGNARDGKINEKNGAGKNSAGKNERAESSGKDSKGVGTTKKEFKPYVYPTIDLLSEPEVSESETNGKLMEKAIDLENALKSYGVSASVKKVVEGPAVTRYEVEPEVGVKVSKITSLADDIALNMKAKSIRIEAPIPGKAAVGIEIENTKQKMVKIRELIGSNEFETSKSKLSFSVGKDISGSPVVADLASMPHLLIAGSTGSGKSVCVNSIITSLIYKATPQELGLILIDPKVVELSNYNGIPHLMTPVVTDPAKAAGVLNWAVTEMTSRYKLFAEHHVRDIKGFNAKVEKGEIKDEEKMSQVVIIIDELADLMMVASKKVESSICRITQMARAAGMHLIVATQRPSVDVITGVIKANIPSRIAFAVSSQVDSRTILDMAGAEKLLGKGDMLYSPIGSNKPVRIQGTFISDDEITDVIDFIKANNEANQVDITDKINKAIESEYQDEDDFEDELYDQAYEIAARSEKISTSMLQRQLRIGYNRAARLIDMLEARGVIGPADGSRPREVLLNQM